MTTKHAEHAFMPKNLRNHRVPSLCSGLGILLLLFCLSCNKPADPNTLVVIIENTPANLDPRVGTDAQSELIDELLFDSLVRKDEHFNLRPAAAASWDIPDPQTYIFHLRHDMRFHDGRPLTARDVKWTLDSMLNHTVISLKASTYKLLNRVDAPDDFTVVIHLTEPYAPMLWNLSEGAFGIVPYGAGKELSDKPVGSGPFRFVRLAPDSEVVLQRNDNYWGEHAHVGGVRFAIVPDTTTRALELRKGSADLASINSLPADMVRALSQDHNLQVERHPGTSLSYLTFNLRDPILGDVRVRHALAHAIDRGLILQYLFGGAGRLADSLLPPEHWAYNGDVEHYPYDPAKANAILDAAGYARGKDGIRFHLTMKTSTEETSRLLAAVLQQEFQKIGVALDIRSFEFATLYSDIQKGAFQLYSLRWIGYTNQDPDIFEYVFHSASFPPKRANRGFYSNPEVDRLIDAGRKTVDQEKRKQLYGEVQRIVARDLPYIDFWYFDNVMVHSKRASNVHFGVSADYQFVNTVELLH